MGVTNHLLTGMILQVLPPRDFFRGRSPEPSKLQQQKNTTIWVQSPGWLFDIGDYTTQLYGDYFISQYKDPYKPGIMEGHSP